MVGLGDSQTEQRVAAVVVINPNKKTNMEDLLKWCNENMEEAEVMRMINDVYDGDCLKNIWVVVFKACEFQVPTLFKLVGEIAKDSTGHVAKLKLAELFPETELVSFHDKKM